ncbi:MAG: DUF4091 domain-containing protein [Muribaculaceae bacterium]
MHFPKLFAGLGMLTLFVAACQKPYTPVVTHTEPSDPTALTTSDSAAWAQLSPGIHAAWASTDLRYSRSLVPNNNLADTCKIVAWKGERASAQLLIWSPDSISGLNCKFADFKDGSHTLAPSIADARFVRYALADTLTRVGGPAMLMPDMIDTLTVFDMSPRNVRPVWVTVSIPADAEAGTYTSEVTVSGRGNTSVTLPLSLEVQNHTLPEPSQWSYHLDLWQHPSAVARAYGLEVWSNEHFDALRPIMQRLANAGQKVVTATLNKDPWNHQCYDAYEPMIKWTRKADGTWSYDYGVFDRWVEMMTEIGIDDMINCYSMVPWNCELEYYDQAQDSTITVVAEPGKPVFEELWTPFLTDFSKHLASKGWLGKTNIAMDERTPEAMDAAIKVLQKCAPDMGFALADMHSSYKKYTMMRDVCVAQGQPADLDDIVKRRAQGYNTTFYICCGPAYPNTFTNSNPYEAELLGWYGLSYDYDGMLRWAYNSWPADPVNDTRYGAWNGGDTFLVYPGNRSSMRFERLINGIESAEKVRILRAQNIDVSPVDSVLAELRNNNINDPSLPWQSTLAKARHALDQVSR